MQTKTRKAFTLLELLVVIVIIAILASLFASRYGQVRENGWSTRCKANLRTLYQASMNYANDHGSEFPRAGANEASDPKPGGSVVYNENKGWVDWTTSSGSTGVWPSVNTPLAGTMQTIWWGKNARASIINGSLWDYTSHDMSIYYCPKFKALMPGYDVVRSYAMNSYFGCYARTSAVSIASLAEDGSREATRTLMFADMQNTTIYPGANKPTVCTLCADGVTVGNGTVETGNDSVLDAMANPSPNSVTYETIGYIHPMSGQFYGHGVFLDGHVDAIGLANLGGNSWSNRTHDACEGLY